MKHFQITSAQIGGVLFEGKFRRFRHCIEQAVKDGVNLDGADLSNKNLSNAGLDDARLNFADFSGANLSGANLSEARLHGASFAGADLYNTCFAYSDMRACRFEDASFGATDITGCNISHSVFSSLSCFSLDFILTARMQSCAFINPDGLVASMSHPPVVVKGASRHTIVFMDRCIKIGHELLDYPDGVAFLRETHRKIN